MPLSSELLARRIMRYLYAYTEGRSQRWVPLDTIKRRRVLKDGKPLSAALEFGVKSDWLLFEGSHSVCLTDAGRRIAKP